MDNLYKTFQQANLKLQQDYMNLQNITDKKVVEFVDRILCWYLDENKKHLLYQLFHPVLSFDCGTFMYSLASFVSNALLDDSSFVISWYELERDSSNQLIWDNTIDWFNTKLSNRDNPEAFAVVSWDDHNDPDGSQSVDLLLQAMDQTEAHDNKEREHREKMEQEKLELLKRIYGPNN